MWAETTQGLTFQHSSDKTRKKMETFQTAKKTQLPINQAQIFFKE